MRSNCYDDLLTISYQLHVSYLKRSRLAEKITIYLRRIYLICSTHGCQSLKVDLKLLTISKKRYSNRYSLIS